MHIDDRFEQVWWGCPRSWPSTRSNLGGALRDNIDTIMEDPLRRFPSPSWPLAFLEGPDIEQGFVRTRKKKRELAMHFAVVGLSSSNRSYWLNPLDVVVRLRLMYMMFLRFFRWSRLMHKSEENVRRPFPGGMKTVVMLSMWCVLLLLRDMIRNPGDHIGTSCPVTILVVRLIPAHPRRLVLVCSLFASRKRFLLWHSCTHKASVLLQVPRQTPPRTCVEAVRNSAEGTG